MSKEYPVDRKIQKAADQDRMLRILKRREKEANQPGEAEPTTGDDSGGEKGSAAGGTG